MLSKAAAHGTSLEDLYEGIAPSPFISRVLLDAVYSHLSPPSSSPFASGAFELPAQAERQSRAASAMIASAIILYFLFFTLFFSY
jgi:hypothetical protein